MNFKLPILYSRTSTGAIEQWTIEVNGNKFRTIHGQIDGVLQTTEWTICEPKNTGRKNATTGEEQALKEAQARHKKKLKEDYFLDVKDIDQRRFVQCMLADKFLDRRQKITYPVTVDCKFNGGRIIATRSGLYTRTGERYLSIPHIENALRPLFDKHPDLVLDGEGFNFNLREKLNEIMKLLRKSVHISEEDLKKSEQSIEYHVYDGFGFGNVTQDTLFVNRRVELIPLIYNIPYIKPVIGEVAHNEAQVFDIFNQYIEERHEGVIVRLNGPYENRRSKYLLKLKPTDDDEFLIIGVEEGSGNWSGLAKKVCLRMDNGKEFKASFKGTMEEAAIMLQDAKQYIGKTATIFYNGMTGLGTPNYAQFDFNNWDNSRK